jgi:16S rRNA (uracil1498-N3)-methyltransferase
MGIQRFFIAEKFIQDEKAALPAHVQEQMRRVLRLKDGDRVIVLDSQGMEYLLRLEQDAEGNFSGKIISTQENTAEPRTRLSLYIALTQREKFEWILQKGTETGVAVFQPLICERSLVQDNKGFGKKQARWEKILREAAEQCGRGRVPLLEPPLDLKDALSKAEKEHDLNLTAWVGEGQTGLQAALRDFSAGRSLGLFIGPEGGFSEAEIARMRLSSLRTFSLGARVLRMETAAILAPALVLYQLGEMRQP